MENEIKLLENYYKFKQGIKQAKNKKKITEIKCYITRREDIMKWKKYYEYDESFLFDKSKLNEWITKINKKKENQEKPTFKILQTYNEIQNELTKGICIINQKFLSNCKFKSNHKVKEINCYIGNQKVLLEFYDYARSHCFICKIGKEEKVRYIFLDYIKTYKKEIADEIIEANEDLFILKKFVSSYSKFNINIFYRVYTGKNNIKNNYSNSSSISTEETLKYNNYISNNNEKTKNPKNINNNLDDKKNIKNNISLNKSIKIKIKTNTEINKNNNLNDKNNLNINSQNIINNNNNNLRGRRNNFKINVKENPIKNPSHTIINKEENTITNLKNVPFTPMIGLENIGKTCYMNAALQCFNNTDILVNYFLNPNKKDFIENNAINMINPDAPQLSKEFKKLIIHLWGDKPKSSYPPHQLKRVIGEIDPLFQNFEANDAKDFVNFLIMRLHEELNFVDNSFSNKSNLSLPEDNINPYNYKQVLNYYIYDFEMNLNSIISNIFYGTVQGEFECLNCKARLYQAMQNVSNIKYSFQNYFFLNFPLEEVRKFIVSNQMLYMNYMNMRINPNLEVNLIDCFKYYFRDEYMNGYCDSCGDNNAQILSRSKLFTIPTYLILLFNRGKGIQYNIKINFPEYLDTNEIALNPNGIYQLYGVVKHFGDSSASGHFTAYCRSPIDNLWYFYNDHAVTLLNENEKYKISEIGLTYILFYKKFKNK